jgi:hypothetical protein
MFRPDFSQISVSGGEVDASEQKSEHLEACTPCRWEVAVLPPGPRRQRQDRLRHGDGQRARRAPCRRQLRNLVLQPEPDLAEVWTEAADAVRQQAQLADDLRHRETPSEEFAHEIEVAGVGVLLFIGFFGVWIARRTYKSPIHRKTECCTPCDWPPLSIRRFPACR